MSADAEYLVSTVGPVLSKSVAECLIADPEDPVAFVGQWLKQYVKNVGLIDQVRQEQAKDQASAARVLYDAAAADSALQADISHKERVTAQIADMSGYALEVWEEAAKAIVENTSAASAYVLAVAPALGTDYAFPEEDEEVPESDDEQAVPAADDEQAEPDEAADPEAEAAEAEVAVEPVDPEAVKKEKWDYSRHHLQYAAAAPAHQVRVLTETQLLERPAPAAEDEEEGAVKETAPVTMKILDENMPSLHVPNTLEEPLVKFHNGFPAIGAYYAAAAKQENGQFSCILAADTLIPHGDGQPFSPQDRNFIWNLSLVVGKRIEQYQAARISARLQQCLAPTIEETKDALKAIREAPVQKDGEEGSGEGQVAQAEDGAEEAAADEEATPAAEEEEELPELDPEAELPVQLEYYKKVVARLEKKLGALQAPKANAQTLLEVETKCMDTIKETLLAKRDAVLDELRSYLHAPAATWHVLKAIFRLLKREEDLGKSWRQALGVLNADLFNDLAKFDIKTDHDSASWKAVRCAYKAAGGPAAALKQWQYEMPKSCAGAFLMLFIRQARKCLKAWKANEALHLEIMTCQAQQEKDSEMLSSVQEKADKAAAEAAAAEGENAEAANEEGEGDE